MRTQKNPVRKVSAKAKMVESTSDSLDTRQLLRVLAAVQKGDFTVRMPVDTVGVAGKVADTLNDIIDLNERMAKEFERIGTMVGKEGRITQRATVASAVGSWADCVESVNMLVADLIQPTTEMGRVIGAVAKGDLSQTMALEVDGRPLKGEFLRTARLVNGMVEQLGSFASEVTRVAREVGTEGKLGGQAKVKGVAGTWKDLTDNVNSMASNLTSQVRNIAEVTTAVARGDLSKKITVDVRGEILELKNTINTMVDQLSSFASEVTRVAREVGTEGKLGGQAVVKGVGGTWKDLTDNVNSMASNLTAQVRNIAEVTTAVANGDLSQKITVDVRGEILELKNTINTMVDQLSSFASEVTRVAREVGTEGKLGGQAVVKGVAGTWKDLTDNVNSMASNLTAQVRNIAEVTTAVANGDLSKKITVDVQGEILELKNTINTMVDQLSSFASEVTRVAREVGTEGKLGGQAVVKGVGGTWKDLTDNVNSMASNLTAQVRNIAEVTTAVANGDLSKKITVDVRGEILELKNTINTMVDQLSSFASEVTRVAREVGTEGKLGGQAVVKGVGGTWKDLTDNVNSMASNLTAQVRNIAEVTTAVANGDLSKKITVDVRGEILELKNTINTMVDQLSSFASEVTRVAREVGTEGKLGGQAIVRGVGGTWKDLTDNVNSMASNLTSQVRNIAEVTTAVARGDLSKKITVDVRGEILELKNTINTMVDQLSSFASEVTRVAREVGTEGKLGGQAVVKGVGGTWKDLTDNVNSMASNLTAQVRNIAEVTTAVANGDLSKKITVDVRGEILELKNTINTMVDQLSSFASEVTRVAREVGTEGKLGGQAVVKGVAGTWKDLTDNVNSMASNLTAQVRNIAEVTTAVANGDLSKKITVDVQGEIAELKNTINTMVDQLSSFASEVTRVAREVGTEGKLGGQAVVKGVAGTWKDLTDNVNSMATNLTTQVRGIAKVVTAVANGDLKRKLVVDAKGEIAELADTINGMIDTLAVFADQVTTVAREVGIEGKLGGQARVPGTAGIWRDLTDNVNQLAANLTTQVRAIAEVATAVTKGDLTRFITVSAQGEVAALKDNINEMIRNLKDTTRKNTEQDWLKTNLAKFTRVLQGQRDLLTVSKVILSELAPLVDAQHGVFYISERIEGDQVLKLLASYAYRERKGLANAFKLGEGLVGQCALEKEPILLSDIPDSYIRISSGLGEEVPRNIVVLPVLFEGDIKAVIELASFHKFSEVHLGFLEQLTESIGIVLNTIAANMRTEALLKQSQALTDELRKQQEELTETNKRLEQQANSLQQSEELLKRQQEELRRTNEELQEKAKLLSEQKNEVERKNLEVEQAKRALEEKAEQLSLTSKYKSEFLANMSHELRTPLNSLLILSQTLSENTDGNLTGRQVEFARTIHASGADLLELINDILDLSKIESGTMAVDVGPLRFNDLREFVERTFRQVADKKTLQFDISLEGTLPGEVQTDSKRLQQVLKNLLSNAFKFTESGQVTLSIQRARGGWAADHPILRTAPTVVAFVVHDTGIGIPKDKHQIIFEAFQQADGSTARKYGGTGLGLSISREIARLLGGEIRLESEVGRGSTFTLYLPLKYVAPRPAENVPSTTMARVAANVQALPPPVPEAPAPQMDAGHHREIEDDSASILPGDAVLLAVTHTQDHAARLRAAAQGVGFKLLVSSESESALEMARNARPVAIAVDLDLPDMAGWVVLDRLKHDASTRALPVYTVSGTDHRERSLNLGALGHLLASADPEAAAQALRELRDFVDRKGRSLLIVEDDDVHRQTLVELLGSEEVHTVAVGTAAQAREAIAGRRFDCMVLDLGLPDVPGSDFLRSLHAEHGSATPPAIVYTGRELTRAQETELRRVAEAIVVKDAQSPERLLEETSLFLHRAPAQLSEPKRRMLEKAREKDPLLMGRKVLVVDDDVRNIFALNTVLERYGMKVAFAESGTEGIALLEKDAEVELVLMDVMMPEMDGYQAMRAIRHMDRFAHLPILALTAKAMKGDREKCLEAGASDYITKPVDIEKLLSLLRVWLHVPRGAVRPARPEVPG
ncbi:GAF sensor hybrid histidine kinase [Stigmatella aurantiaca]|uniref:histidine kinase n=1 Tax=Stigmatella aurantiaca TaxID=41 RepID=A0A1H7YS69_STIAU|nr:HAMP domain-containing protein [Stigmatella aurantiaca]SEM48148.1 GAF sensor hybrid histidine kinase [Stigmatella aurantiaca]